MSDLVLQQVAGLNDEDGNLSTRIYSDGVTAHMFILSRVPVPTMNGLKCCLWLLVDPLTGGEYEQLLSEYSSSFREGLEVRGNRV